MGSIEHFHKLMVVMIIWPIMPLSLPWHSFPYFYAQACAVRYPVLWWAPCRLSVWSRLVEVTLPLSPSWSDIAYYRRSCIRLFSLHNHHNLLLSEYFITGTGVSLAAGGRVGQSYPVWILPAFPMHSSRVSNAFPGLSDCKRFFRASMHRRQESKPEHCLDLTFAICKSPWNHKTC